MSAKLPSDRQTLLRGLRYGSKVGSVALVDSPDPGDLPTPGQCLLAWTCDELNGSLPNPETAWAIALTFRDPIRAAGETIWSALDKNQDTLPVFHLVLYPDHYRAALTSAFWGYRYGATNPGVCNLNELPKRPVRQSVYDLTALFLARAV